MRIAQTLIPFLLCWMPFGSKGQYAEMKKNGFMVYVDLGADQSLGRNKIFYKQATINRTTTINYYSHKRYVNPSLRLRLNMKVAFTEKVGIGLQSGFTWHSGENYYGASFNYFTLPIQFILTPSYLTSVQTNYFSRELLV